MTRALNSSAFFKIFKEALIAFSFGIGGVLAGFIVASQLNIFRSPLFPWAIAVYPAVLSAKGVISGLFSGRLSTALHIGAIYPRFFGNTKSFYKLFETVIVITLEASVAMSLVSVVFGSLFWGITFADFSNILMVVVATMTLGLTVSLLTIAVAFVTFKKGLDQDVIVYPIMSTVMDIVVTIFYVLTLNLFFFFGSFGKYAVAFIGFLPMILMLYILPRNIHEEVFVETIKESFFTVMFVALIVNVTGTVLKSISEKVIVEDMKEIYTVYPALIGTVGSVGSVVGSTATTKLALGLLKPSFSAMRNHGTRIFGTWAASMIMFVSFSALSLFINGTFAVYRFLGFSSLLLTANIMAVTAIVLISYAVSILTFKKGLDPDNFVIPIESSLADSITSIALLVALFFVNYMVYEGV
jgi:mgtE-like transporter